SGISGTSYQVSGLSNSTTYYWRVQAVNSAGSSSWSAAWSFTTASPGKKTITITEPQAGTLWKAGEDRQIAWQSANIKYVTIAFSTDDDNTWQSIVDSVAANSQLYNWTVPDLTADNVHIRISDSRDTSISSISDSFHIYGSKMTLDTTYSFHGRDYQLVGLPGNGQLPVNQVLKGQAGKDWMVYYDNGQAQNYLVSYDSSTVFTFKPGRGFWVISNNDVKVSRQTPTVQLDQDTSFSIPLHSGWNIISTPFNLTVSWSTVQQANQIPDSVWAYSGGQYHSSAYLTPYHGYYLYNRKDLSKLKIPYMTVSSKRYSEVNTRPPLVQIIATPVGSHSSSTVNIGFSEKGEREMKDTVQYAPPRAFEPVRLTLYQDGHEGPKDLNTVLATYSGGSLKYTLHLLTKPNNPVRIHVRGLQEYPEYTFYLSEDSGDNHDLNDNSSVTLQPQNKMTIMTLWIKKNDNKITDNKETKPQKFSLDQNYPNPFNDETVIGYSIPTVYNGRHVELTIFNILGNEVCKLVDRQQSSGNYTIHWNAGDYSSGVYLYQLKIGNHEKTKKMLLLK
ncbi:MAG TPA: T9SS type A sorting domain-containing protein, partial [Balneolales bacterium]|nr:T9SS type A sorting domain-containing protein [Balneolales bacterium]